MIEIDHEKGAGFRHGVEIQRHLDLLARRALVENACAGIVLRLMRQAQRLTLVGVDVEKIEIALEPALDICEKMQVVAQPDNAPIWLRRFVVEGDVGLSGAVAFFRLAIENVEINSSFIASSTSTIADSCMMRS